jgi:hypothetical protein
MPLFICPVGVKLANATLNHDSRAPIRGIRHGDSFCRRLGRENGRISAIDHFDPELLHRRSSK